MQRVLRAWLTAALPLALAGLAAAAEYKSPKGFSLDCPEGWVVASDDGNDSRRAEVLANYPELKTVDPNHTAAFLFRPRDSGFAENISVAVIQGAVRANSENEKMALREANREIHRLGVVVENAHSGQMRVADRQAIWIRCDLRPPGGEAPLRQWQVFVPGGGRTYVVTCTAPAAEFDAAEPAFAKVIASIRVQGKTGSLWGDLPGVAKGIILGVAIWGLTAVLRLLRKARRAAAEPPPPQADPSAPYQEEDQTSRHGSA